MASKAGLGHLIIAGLAVLGMVKCSIDNESTSQRATTPDPRFDFAVLAGKTLKANLNDPQSLEWQSIGVNHDGTVACLIYRAKNKFGARVLEEAVALPGGISTKDKDWNTHCAGKSMTDYTFARHAM